MNSVVQVVRVDAHAEDAGKSYWTVFGGFLGKFESLRNREREEISPGEFQKTL
jgi:hypothetical protein